MNTTHHNESLQNAYLHPHTPEQAAAPEHQPAWNWIRPCPEPSSTRRILWVLALLVFGAAVLPQVLAQQCSVRYETVNKDRYVYGGIDTECSGPHSKPFGNWGVNTEVSNLVDGRQFEGWCHIVRACDRDGTCKWHCRDSWYEWNSCTFHAWAPPLEGFYNYNNNSQQRSTRGVNVHGAGTVIYRVACPEDTNGDLIADRGGCIQPSRHPFRVSGHRMELYELDGKGLLRAISVDTHVETLRFPTLTVRASGVSCSDVDGCDAESVGTWNRPSHPPSSSRKTDAKAAIRIQNLLFSDPDSLCCDPIVEDCD